MNPMSANQLPRAIGLSRGLTGNGVANMGVGEPVVIGSAQGGNSVPPALASLSATVAITLAALLGMTACGGSHSPPLDDSSPKASRLGGEEAGRRKINPE